MAEIVQMPMASQTMEEGKIVKWLKKEGDKVKRGEELVEIETDKTVMAIESFYDGVVLKIVAGEGDMIKVLKPIAIIGKQGEKINTEKLLGSDAPKASVSKPVPEPAPVEQK